MEWILLSIIVLGVIFIALPLVKVFKGSVSALSAKKELCYTLVYLQHSSLQ